MREYTSEETSDQLVSAARMDNPVSVVDFCAGKGRLLASARRRWPGARLYANDIDPSVLGALPNTHWTNLDFLTEDFEKFGGSQTLQKFDVILLNPPFSFDRNQEHSARGSFANTRCSVAFAFLFTALEYLSEHGELLGVLPTSTLKSERDTKAREELKKFFKCNIVSPPSYDRFPGLDVSTYLIRIRKKQSRPASLKNPVVSIEKTTPWIVSRGSISVRRGNRVQQSGLHGWIHTTSIKSSKVTVRYELPSGRMAGELKFVPKNSLVLPRVGKVSPGDLLVTRRREILSDCLLGVTFDDLSLPFTLLSKIENDFSSFKQIYSGTGAPYTTKKKVSIFLANIIFPAWQSQGGEPTTK
ncbi:methyltransferase [Phaeobacter marinintestinus]|uniref:methyltransferase n=1 Tax=Falsiphaeobacter marinintestinus TaxID=1492905 RepID=UPI0011B5483C|nr:methyltransferase [Phaeobacter marinintestinus]